MGRSAKDGETGEEEDEGNEKEEVKGRRRRREGKAKKRMSWLRTLQKIFLPLIILSL